MIGAVRFYQVAISPLLPSSCRHQPTCSQYMIDAITEWGVVKGLILGTKRLLRCHPWGTQGYDPVPKKKIYANEFKR
ncbi:membrane protein insertion efficiency factor YidD [Ulvibacterium sp.]|uniref:membrane protein insertion efficiency factor YidD n=1 Tax=Ulvibacterium sp. TaxID=2665914 RepID=UPI002609845E|nr:membrane protein insertion efficiency factor YidD [Ulvibacterium sp.]